MMPRKLIERSTGVLMLLAVGSLVALMASGYGIGAEEQYFRDDFPDLTRHLDGFKVSLVVGAITGLLLIVTAAALSSTLRSRDSLLASIGSFGLLAAGIVMLINVAAGRSLYDLAVQWRDAGGTEGDPVWTSARAVALIYEGLAGFSMMLLVGSLLAFGAAALQQGLVPRGLGWLGIAGGAVLVLGLALGAVTDHAWYLIMGSVLVGLVWLLLTGAWLLLRGTSERPLQADGRAH